MPKQYSGMRMSLLYPDSWTITEDSPGQPRQGIILESPGGSFLSINLLEGEQQEDEVIRLASEAMTAEYEDIESETLNLQIANREFVGVVQRFYYLDFVIVSKLIAMQIEDGVYLIQIQGEDRDIDQQTLVFEAILTSMLRSLAEGKV